MSEQSFQQVDYITQMRQGVTFSGSQKIRMVIRLSIPAILAQISSIIMEYIDAAMVGTLGAEATASIGMVASTTWLVGGCCIGASTGFAVQAAQLVGAGQMEKARNVLRQALIVLFMWGIVLALIGMGISEGLPGWLGSTGVVKSGASSYFLIYACALPALQMRQLAGSMLQCSGDMKTPSILNTIMCGLDIILNSLLIFPSRYLHVFGYSIFLPGADLGIRGAALGTALSEVIVALCMLYALCIRSPQMRITERGSWKIQLECLKTAVKIAVPISLEQAVLSSAQIALTKVIVPLGTVAVAANSLGVTAESVCFMPAYGIAAAATSLVGQSIGANRVDMTRAFARLSVWISVVLATAAGVLMFFLAPFTFRLLTPDRAVQMLGTKILRIEMLAEPLFAVSIVTAGALRGAGDTLIPGLINFVSMWAVRVVPAIVLAPIYGLTGVWIVMCLELCVRGMLFLVRLLKEKWIKNSIVI